MRQEQSPYAPQAPTNGMAIASLASGIAGVTVVPLIGSIAALICGYKARGQLAAARGSERGGTLATAGIVLGWLGTALAIVGIVIFLAFFAFATEQIDELKEEGRNEQRQFEREAREDRKRFDREAREGQAQLDRQARQNEREFERRSREAQREFERRAAENRRQVPPQPPVPQPAPPQPPQP